MLLISKNKMNTKNKGFTLIEMLVVVAIIGLLSAVVVVGLTGAREKARDSRRVADLREIQNQLELDYDSSTGYPADIQGYLDAGSSETPTDPQNNTYKYSAVDSDGNNFNESYEVGACVENLDNISTNSVEGCSISCSGGEGTLFCATPQ